MLLCHYAPLHTTVCLLATLRIYANYGVTTVRITISRDINRVVLKNLCVNRTVTPAAS